MYYIIHRKRKVRFLKSARSTSRDFTQMLLFWVSLGIYNIGWWNLSIYFIMCFTGYRFFKAVMFLTGFIFTSVLVYLVLSQHSLLPVEGNIGVALGSGLLIGLLTMLVQYVGLFFTGFQLGAAIGVVSLIVVDLFVFIPIHWIRIGVICGAGLICAIVTLKFQKGGMILGTSVFGGALMVSCLDYFIEQLAMVTFVWGEVTGTASSLVCWYSWVLLGCWLFCFLVGAVTQWRITGQGYDHNEGEGNPQGISWFSPDHNLVCSLIIVKDRKIIESGFFFLIVIINHHFICRVFFLSE